MRFARVCCAASPSRCDHCHSWVCCFFGFFLSVPTTFHFSSICQEYYPPSHPSRSIHSLILIRLPPLISILWNGGVILTRWRKTNGLSGYKSADRVTVCLVLRFSAMQDLGTSWCFHAHMHQHTLMNKGPCHVSFSPLMSSISFPHSSTWPYQPQSCWAAIVPVSPPLYTLLSSADDLLMLTPTTWLIFHQGRLPWSFNSSSSSHHLSVHHFSFFFFQRELTSSN